jgi:hypothetical protein
VSKRYTGLASPPAREAAAEREATPEAFVKQQGRSLGNLRRERPAPSPLDPTAAAPGAPRRPRKEVAL